MSLPRAGGLVTAWQGTPLGPGKPSSRGTEPDLQHGIEATQSALLCFFWVVLGLCSECCCGGRGTSLRTKAVGNTVEHTLHSWSCWDVWLPSYIKGDASLCLGPLGDVGCAAASISGRAHVSLGKTHSHPCESRILQGCGDNLTVGTSHEVLHPTLYPTAYCQGGGLSTMWDQGHPKYLPACPMEGLRVLLRFAHFGGFCAFCWM